MLSHWDGTQEKLSPQFTWSPLAIPDKDETSQSPVPKVPRAVLAGTCPPVALILCVSKAETFQCHLLPPCADPSLGPAGREPGRFGAGAAFPRAPA